MRYSLWCSIFGGLVGGASATQASPAHMQELKERWGEDWAFSGITTFGHLEHVHCLTNPDTPFDIGIIGTPFDTAVSYRPGARMGPRAIRTASARHIPSRAFHAAAQINPYQSWARVLDCGDIPVTPFDNAVAVHQMTEAYRELGSRRTTTGTGKPKLITLGGDHLVALPALRALREQYGEPVALLHFDSHLDSLHPDRYPSAWTSMQSQFNHGSVFWNAMKEGLISNSSSLHAGINTRLSGNSFQDLEDDDKQGFLRIAADEVDTIGAAGIVDRIHQHIPKDQPVYMSIDIDVLDPAFAPGTGAPEPGGWTTREMIKILRGVMDLNIVGADIVEVAPAYDTPGGETAYLAANLAYELVTGMVAREQKSRAPAGGQQVPVGMMQEPNEYEVCYRLNPGAENVLNGLLKQIS
ncbi:agmatinase [Aspergillus vadensis CBS 113365]|uniref:Arginase/deacetylase n=1 Tax=Aspergillus vadensis (strain CBS 113365 / IMI 142717 / IBT 24658) TaxID=1448311 RepID=A0A319BHK3_ASPVC|nr:Arginase/deacetylase [Aspergillus vadensis CBS 113365]PYH72107.1 Arginase/deacetylase [Aspergillus vadensis CBS 113365]